LINKKEEINSKFKKKSKSKIQKVKVKSKKQSVRFSDNYKFISGTLKIIKKTTLYLHLH